MIKPTREMYDVATKIRWPHVPGVNAAGGGRGTTMDITKMDLLLGSGLGEHVDWEAVAYQLGCQLERHHGASDKAEDHASERYGTLKTRVDAIARVRDELKAECDRAERKLRACVEALVGQMSPKESDWTRAYLAEGKKIDAVKVVREALDCGLLAAKTVVEGYSWDLEGT